MLAAYRPPPRQLVSEWADEERRLSPESSASPGQWRTSRVEHTRGFMDALCEPDVKEVCGVFGSQLAKTEAVLNIIGKMIHRDPGPMLVMMPTLELAEAWSKDRLAPMLRDTACLRDLVKDPKSRDTGNTIRHKQFPHGHLTACGANSAASLASRPIRFFFADEVDAFPASAGTEGNPLKIAETRTVAFWNAIKVYISSPRNKGSSLIWPIWDRSDQRRYFVPCRECGHEQALKWAQVQWDKNERGEGIPKTARYVCERCGAWWNDAQRWLAVRRGHWMATKPFSGCAGFHLNALAAPWESRRLEALVVQWLEAQGNPELLKVFYNTVLAEWYEEKYLSLDVDETRREVYPKRDGQVVVPRGVVVITAGVDVQDDRLELQIQGYGRGLEQWKLQYHVLDGDPSAPAVWLALWEVMQRPLALERGGVDFIRSTCVDTGAHTLKAYDFVRPRFRYPTGDGRLAYCFGIKGRGGSRGEFWPRHPNRNNKGKIPLYIVHVDHAKEILYASLKKILEPGAGFIHFPLEVSVGSPFDQRYFDQLTAEKVTDRRSPNGAIERVWELKSERRRNEALDTSVYGEAALRGLFAMGFDLDREAKERRGDLPPAEASGADGVPPPPTPRRPKRRKSSSSYLSGG